GDQLFARIGASGSTGWTFAGRLASVRAIMWLGDGGIGGLSDKIWYDGYGRSTSESNPAFGGRYKWTGRELDAETGLQYNRARYYDAATGRWISQDPLGFDAGDSSLYRYVKNAPSANADPSGLQMPTNRGLAVPEKCM